MVGGARAFSGVSFMRALVPFMKATPSWPHHLPNSTSKYHPIGSYVSTYTFWEDANIQPVVMETNWCGRYAIFGRMARERLSEAVIITENRVIQQSLQWSRASGSCSNICIDFPLLLVTSWLFKFNNNTMKFVVGPRYGQSVARISLFSSTGSFLLARFRVAHGRLKRRR